MKKFLLFPVLLAFGVLASCTKTTTTTTTTTPTVTPVFTATLGSITFTATTVTGSVYSSSYINVLGTASDGSTLKVTMPISITPGSYSIGNGGSNTISYSSKTQGGFTGDGNLTITSNSDNIIKGSFSNSDFISATQAYPTIYGTSGTFAAKYQ